MAVHEALATRAGVPLSHPRGRLPLAQRFLGLPLFWKVLIANVIVVLLGVAFGTWFTLSYVATPSGGLRWEAVALMMAAGFLGTVLINATVLGLALQPLRSLEKTVERVARGDLSTRAQKVLFTDPDVERLGETLNGMLDVLAEHRGQLQKLSEQVLAAQEDERKRIARELHDETAQSLTTLLVRLKMIERARTPTELHEHVQQLRNLTVETLEAVRQLAVELRPSTLDNLGLVAALEASAETHSSRLAHQVVFHTSGFHEAGRLPADLELVLYRVVQEALTNAARHADAQTVRVSLERRRQDIVATVEDDGKGFDVDRVMRSRERGLGLFGMQERLALVGGHLEISSSSNGGTEVRATIPLAEAVTPLGMTAGNDG